MQAIQNHASPFEGKQSAALNRGLQGLFSVPGEKSSGGAETFSREVERAVARQGGEQAVEERRMHQSDAKRSKRHSSFGSKAEGQAEPRLRERPEADELSEAPVPIERQVQASENRRAAQPGVQGEGRGPQSTDAPATSGGERPSHAQAETSGGSALGSQAGNDASAFVAPGVGSAQPAAAGAPAAANATLMVKPNVGARPADASQAFVDAAKGKGEAASTKQTASTARTGDPKLIEHAEKVLRQIRLNVRPGMKQITLNLNPVDLGRLSIDLKMQDSRLTAVVRAESRETLELLKHQAPELRAVLSQQGIETEQLEFDLAFDASADSQRGATKQSLRGKPKSAPESQIKPITTPSPNSSASKHRADGGIDTLA